MRVQDSLVCFGSIFRPEIQSSRFGSLGLLVSKVDTAEVKSVTGN
jgi:hypothetical protein